MKADIYNWQGEKSGSVELSDAIFARPWNADLVHQVATAYLANLRQPWAHAKDRSEVRGGGKKPWRQKGTGRARHGSIRSPIWKGGGVTHGPKKDRDFSQKINKKMLRGAIHSVLSKKLTDGEIRVFKTLAPEAPKTKQFAAFLKIVLPKDKSSVLVIPEIKNKVTPRAARNISRVTTSSAANLNIHEALKSKYIFIEEGALSEIR